VTGARWFVSNGFIDEWERENIGLLELRTVSAGPSQLGKSTHQRF